MTSFDVHLPLQRPSREVNATVGVFDCRTISLVEFQGRLRLIRSELQNPSSRYTCGHWVAIAGESTGPVQQLQDKHLPNSGLSLRLTSSNGRSVSSVHLYRC